MKKEEHIKKYGVEAYKKKLQQTLDWRREHLEEPEKAIANRHEWSHKGGKYYKHYREHQSTGIPGERNLIRNKHRSRYRKYKQIIAPESQIHHEWVGNTAKYRGMALVEREQHQYGFVDVIQILEGKITLFTEDDIKASG